MLATAPIASALLVVNKFQRGAFKMLAEAKVLAAKCIGCGSAASKMQNPFEEVNFDNVPTEMIDPLWK